MGIKNKMDFNKKTFEMEVGGRKLSFEVSDLALQANGAVIARYGETVILATVVMGKEDMDRDYLPLIVDFEGKNYAYGRILGGKYQKREGKATDDAVLSGRMIDRTIRPLFNQGIRREIQLIVTTLAIDPDCSPVFTALAAASLAFTISDVPFNGPAAGVNIGLTKQGLLVNPKPTDLEHGFDFMSFSSGPKGKINMIEVEGVEASEADILAGFKLAQKEIDALVEFQEKIQKEIGKPKAELKIFGVEKEIEAVLSKVATPEKLEGALFNADKAVCETKMKALMEEVVELFKAEGKEEEIPKAMFALEMMLDWVVHEKAIREEKRQDGRKMTEIRPLYGQVGLFERNHGSALFARGTTQSLAITTLGSPEDEQAMDGEMSPAKRFMLHYNFPPYATGETGKMRGPGRREIGHGALAEKALKNMMPSKDVFPYVVRVVSEIVSSNGSSSMASVCGATLSLMDAGVPIRKPVAGIAMGLMSNEKGEYKVLTDIAGAEDHYGDMDFKVAGTADGVTAVQLDTKINGLTFPMISDTMAAAKVARLQILDFIKSVIPAPREETSKYAPVILMTMIDPDKIGLVVGSGGKTINAIVADTGAYNIDIGQNGQIFITAPNKVAGNAALERIASITKDYSVGDIVSGKIVKLLEFGAILEFDNDKDGMIHVSELKKGFVKKVDEVVKLGDFVQAKIIRFENGKFSLSMKALEK